MAFSVTIISMAQCKTMASPVRQHCRCHNLALSHRRDEALLSLNLYQLRDSWHHGMARVDFKLFTEIYEAANKFLSPFDVNSYLSKSLSVHGVLSVVCVDMKLQLHVTSKRVYIFFFQFFIFFYFFFFVGVCMYGTRTCVWCKINRWGRCFSPKLTSTLFKECKRESR